MSASLPSSRSRVRWFLYAGIVVVIALAAWYFSQPRKQSNRWGPNPTWAGNDGQPAMAVRVAAVERRDLPVHLKAIGTVVPLNLVTVRSRVDGQLVRLVFTEGQRVEAGDVLAEIDPEPFKIQLAQAEGEQRQNQAQLETARADLERFQQLYEKSLVTRQQIDAQQALVRQREGAVAADQARVDEARLQLQYTRVVAPLAGRVGLRRVDAGNLVRANDTNGLVVIAQTRPISVLFTVPEVELQRVVAPLRAGGSLPVEAWDRTEQTLLARGELRNVDNQIDLATGTLRLKAEFPNDDETLFPNQFVNIRLRVATLTDAILIPAAAVQYGSRGTYVYTVDDQRRAKLRSVELGPADGEMQAIAKGLEPGEQVVLEGLDRLREGRPVVVVENGEIQAPANPPAKKKK